MKIVVSGESRSGTSLTMNILKSLGYSLAGEKWANVEDDRRHMNPDGFYEVPYMVNYGMDEDLDRFFKEDVVKLTTRGLIATEPELIYQLIYVIRNPREVIVSQRNMNDYPGDKEAFRRYCNNMELLFQFVTPEGWMHHVHILDYGDLMKNPEGEIRRLCRFLRKPQIISEAVSIIKPELYRSKKHKVKFNKKAKTWYNMLYSLRQDVV